MGRALRLSALAAVGAATAFVWRTRRREPADRVELHFADGSMVSLSDAGGGADALLARARDVLDAAR